MSCSAKKICKIRHYDSNFTEVKNDFRRQKLGRKLPELLVFNFLCWAAPINERYTPTVRHRTKQHAEMRVIEAFAKQLHKICVMNRLISKDMLITKVMTTENALTAKMKIIQLLYTPSTELTTLKIHLRVKMPMNVSSRTILLLCPAFSVPILWPVAYILHLRWRSFNSTNIATNRKRPNERSLRCN